MNTLVLNVKVTRYKAQALDAGNNHMEEVQGMRSSKMIYGG